MSGWRGSGCRRVTTYDTHSLAAAHARYGTYSALLAPQGYGEAPTHSVLALLVEVPDLWLQRYGTFIRPRRPGYELDLADVFGVWRGDVEYVPPRRNWLASPWPTRDGWCDCLANGCEGRCKRGAP